MNQPAFDEFRGKEINPGIHIQTDQELEEFIRNHSKKWEVPFGELVATPWNLFWLLHQAMSFHLLSLR